MRASVRVLRVPRATSKRSRARRTGRSFNPSSRSHASAGRPRYIRESASWMVFDAGGDLYCYQFKGPKGSSALIDRQPQEALVGCRGIPEPASNRVTDQQR